MPAPLPGSPTPARRPRVSASPDGSGDLRGTGRAVAHRGQDPDWSGRPVPRRSPEPSGEADTRGRRAGVGDPGRGAGMSGPVVESVGGFKDAADHRAEALGARSYGRALLA